MSGPVEILAIVCCGVAILVMGWYVLKTLFDIWLNAYVEAKIRHAFKAAMVTEEFAAIQRQLSSTNAEFSALVYQHMEKAMAEKMRVPAMVSNLISLHNSRLFRADLSTRVDAFVEARNPKKIA